MTDPHPDEPTVATERGRRLPMRAAALGLLALAALIAAVLIFGGGDSESSAAGDSSSAPPPSTQSDTADSGAPTTTLAETSEGPALTTTQEAPTPTAAPTDATAGQTEALPPAGVTVLVTSQSWNSSSSSIEVVGSVQGVATQSSTCTAKATSGQTVVEATVEGTFDGQGTSCGLISIPMAGQPSGPYDVVITFDAGSGVATSEPVTVTVP